MKESNKKELYDGLAKSYGFFEENTKFLKAVYPEMTRDVNNLYVVYTIIKNGLNQTINIGDIEVNPVDDKVEMLKIFSNEANSI